MRILEMSVYFVKYSQKVWKLLKLVHIAKSSHTLCEYFNYYAYMGRLLNNSNHIFTLHGECLYVTIQDESVLDAASIPRDPFNTETFRDKYFGAELVKLIQETKSTPPS